MMMAGNWGQHAFINVDHVNNGIANAITCINSGYNRRCFNDGYHIGHHLKANRHWSELPGDFIANRERYAKEGAIVFEGIDFFFVSLLLWLGRWDMWLGATCASMVRSARTPRSSRCSRPACSRSAPGASAAGHRRGPSPVPRLLQWIRRFCQSPCRPGAAVGEGRSPQAADLAGFGPAWRLSGGAPAASGSQGA